MRLIKQSQTAQNLTFLMVLASDHVSPATGLTPTVTLSKAGGSFASPSGAVSEIGNGWYKVAGNATDSNTLGSIILHASAATADPTDREYEIVAFDPQSATAFITGINSLAPPANWNLASIDANGRVDVIKVAGTTQTARDLGASVLLSVGTGTGQVNLASGKAPATIAAGDIATDALTAAAVKADAVTKIQSGLSTYAGGDTAGTTTLLARLTSTRAALLDNLDAAVSGIAAAVWAVATRTLTAISDSSGVTTLLSRLTSGRATLLDNLDVAVSSRNATTPPTVAAIRSEIDTNSTKLDVAVSTRNAITPPTVAEIGTQITTDHGSGSYGGGGGGGGSGPDVDQIATSVWAYGNRTLSSFGTLIADIWSYITAGGVTPAPVIVPPGATRRATLQVNDQLVLGTRSRFVVLPNGAALEVKDAGGNWIRQKEWIKNSSIGIDEFLFNDDSIVTYS